MYDAAAWVPVSHDGQWGCHQVMIASTPVPTMLASDVKIINM